MNPNESNPAEIFEKNLNDGVNITECIETYGILISDSLNVDNRSLIECLDKILDVLKGYLILISKVRLY